MPSDTSTTTLSPEALEADLYTHLFDTSTLEDLHANLLSSLQRSGWTERIRSLSLELLRAGRCDHFDDVVDAVVALASGKSHPAVHLPDNDGGAVNGEGHDPDVEAFFENIDVKIPPAVVDQGVKAIKDALRPIASIEDDGEEDEQQTKKEPVAPAVAVLNHNKKASKAKESTTGSRVKNGDASPTKKAVKHKKPKTGSQGR
jgi:hypothetical protein